MNQPVDAKAARHDYYRRIAGHGLTPLWELMAALVPEQPRSPFRPHLWRYQDIRPALLESGRLITAREAVRRVLILENPGMPGSSAITQSLYAGLQVILPGEVAPSHRHTQSALRLIVEGEGAYTAVEGERVTMHPGDFIITPSWAWHDHGSEAEAAVVWLDGLDIPLVRFLDCGFAENLGAEVQPLTRPEGDALARFGANLLPLDWTPAGATSPVFAYPYARSREALHRLARAGDPDAVHGIRMQFINPATGGPAMPTIGTTIQWLPAGFSGAGYRCTDGTVFHVIEGSGECCLEGAVLPFGPRDTFVVPSWTEHRLAAHGECVLFAFSDRPVQRALGLWREWRAS
ncbi:MAG: gentisate 1,2-dioxygenase [Betaproteobacteria bacterium]|jgi:gentisate 1,2-dioxygenase|nr:gentisate 1,2-dioxygenase [Rhodocyclaceae bacterium]MCA3133249.1 gentisate 1,2-dioxygenase [Rhodocyclaceae bacterium]MCA3140660.1 gentisate 1,2-dioxygenase [Rhodocyclaceae bacterium]MCA3144247.1 gentisate 1,2-dioxygenase [Rhodocyclaceae bacterium]MCE2897836.1 gentisate 1,2-dioxygenase [Betaproteobacteria bacterium]